MWPIEFRFGDNPYCGLQLKHLEIELLVKKIYSLRQLLFKPDTSQFVLNILAWYQHVSGFSFRILENHP